MSTVEETTQTPATGTAAPTAASPEPGPASRRRVRMVVAVAAAVIVAGVAAGAALGVFGGGADGTPAASQLPPATAEVTRTTMVRTETFDGTLGYGEATTVSAFAGDGQAGAGILTWRPGVGDMVARGEPVYSVNAEPVVLMYGDMPFFRSLQPGDRGVDVAQLEENLAELGFDGFTVDKKFTWATAEAVSQWQDELGLEPTGRFAPARAVVAPGEIRVAEHLAPLGATANGAVLAYTATDRVVTVELEVADRRYVAEEMPVTVTLPDGAPVEGVISSVGTVATGGESADGMGQQESEPTTVEVVVTVDDPEALGDWDTAPVDVAVEVDRREDVLAVPVGALVALAEGGYGVQLVDGDQTSYLAVSTGVFADGLVEVSGAGLTEGLQVGVAS